MARRCMRKLVDVTFGSGEEAHLALQEELQAAGIGYGLNQHDDFVRYLVHVRDYRRARALVLVLARARPWSRVQRAGGSA